MSRVVTVDTGTPLIDAGYLQRWEAARSEREHQRRSPYSYLAYAGFHKLGPESSRFDDIPGSWHTGPDGPGVELAYGEELLVDGQLINGSHRFAPVREREFRRAAQFGGVILELSKRGGQDLLRPLDPDHGRTVSDRYDHTPAYHPDSHWIVEATYIPFDAVRPVELDATVGDIVHVHPALGEITFDVDGESHRLLIIGRDDPDPGPTVPGIALFTDGTSGSTTDTLGRSLYLDLPAAGGPLTLDFNFARNLQRPYTGFAPCALPPPQNVIAVAVEAGDQLPVFRAG